MTDKPIRATPGQKRRLFQCHPGVGFIVWKSGPNEITEVEFYTDRDGTLRRLGDNASVLPLEITQEGNDD